MKISIPHSKTYLGQSEVKAVSQVIRSGHIAMGIKVKEFEEKLAATMDKKFAICLDSGFSALRLSLIALNIKENDKVGFPAYSCVAIINAILSIGAIPVPLDNSFDTNTIDIETCDFLKLKALIVVHTFGEPVNVRKMKEKISIPIIEDCTHAFGEKLYGEMGDLVVLSFYATKLIGIGEGGAILTNSETYKEKVLEWRSYVDQKPDKHKFNNKMTDMEGALGICQLNKLEEIIEKRAHLAKIYNDQLKNLEQYEIQLPKNILDRIWYRYVLRVPKNEIGSLKKYLNSQGIFAELPIHQWADSFEGYPNARFSFLKNLSLPLYPSLKSRDQALIIKHIWSYFHADR